VAELAQFSIWHYEKAVVDRVVLDIEIGSDMTVVPISAPRDPRCNENEIALGTALRHAREKRGLTLDHIASETRIPRRHLEALERGDLRAIPGAFYRRAQARVYARTVRLDQGRTTAWLERAMEALRDDSAAPTGPPSEQSPSLYRPSIIVSAAISFAVLLAVAAWNGRPLGDKAVQTSTGTQVRVLEPATPVGHDTALPANSSHKGEPIEQVSPPVEFEPGLIITTQPVGARVTVNGIGWGLTPVTIPYLQPGNKQIRVTKDGYATEERVVLLTGARPATTVQIPLRVTSSRDRGSTVN
jgi:transcriptional regulator with XRE-family HTH domain